ncbi:phospholipase D-like domain-containing protein [Lacinutrix mariniflava]|uniref:phospholipase D-like domain-containing protein n=1 Tax=Lacinutrix mariniflava TaxID=342955 RepID=UPI0006E33A5F|nr:phospholipase D-like domain-containing protein [Lacinutrix mariniflava]
MQIDSYFTKQIDVRKIILEHLDSATIKVIVAVAWFTDTILFNKLLELQDKGVVVDLIITKHKFNTDSRNNYHLINENGFFAEIGSDDQLMHMKFCVIDYSVVISGSANWSNRAFTVNNEEVTIVSGNQLRTNSFVEEFERLKELSGKIIKYENALDISKAFKYFKLIKAFVDLGDTSSIQPYIHELKLIEELTPITNLLLAGNYDLAFLEIDKFEKNYTQLVDVTAIEKAQIVSQIKLLSYQIETLEIEKTEIEAQIEQFNHRYIIELNPLISKILALKKKIYEKLKKHGIVDDTFEKIEEEFNQTNKEYQEELEIEIPELNKVDSADLKKMHREAVKLCHPDSPSCIYEDKAEAARVFSELTNAVKVNDIERVKFLWNELKLGNPISDIDIVKELVHLRVKLETLKAKYNYLFNELSLLQISEIWKMILKIEDWSLYFENQKTLLEQEHESLIEKYVDHE